MLFDTLPIPRSYIDDGSVTHTVIWADKMLRYAGMDGSAKLHRSADRWSERR
jgi:hypothetical protein